MIIYIVYLSKFKVVLKYLLVFFIFVEIWILVRLKMKIFLVFYFFLIWFGVEIFSVLSC